MQQPSNTQTASHWRANSNIQANQAAPGSRSAAEENMPTYVSTKRTCCNSFGEGASHVRHVPGVAIPASDGTAAPVAHTCTQLSCVHGAHAAALVSLQYDSSSQHP